MSQSNTHLSDRDLIMAADGELTSRRKAQVAAHLEACWACRERKSVLESTISEFVHARNWKLQSDLPDPAGPRALLRARLAEEVRRGSGDRWRGLWRRLWPAAAFAAALVATGLVSLSPLAATNTKPKRSLTPGDTRPVTISEVCRTSRAEVVASVSEETRKRVFSAYGIHAHQENFEVDYLITPDLGGAKTERNLWPQPYDARWNARAKDELEQRLHDLVCGGQLNLATAQREIAADWIGAYRKYVTARH